MKRWGCELLAGGALWLAGVVLLESGLDVDSFAVRACFFVAGLLAGLGLWGLRTPLPSMVAKCGAVLTAFTVALVAVGFAIGSFAGFLLAYVGQLFLIPLGMVILAVGLWRRGGLPAWATWIPAFMAGAGLITYGFHALARDIWDPPDATLFVIIGHVTSGTRPTPRCSSSSVLVGCCSGSRRYRAMALQQTKSPTLNCCNRGDTRHRIRPRL